MMIILILVIIRETNNNNNKTINIVIIKLHIICNLVALVKQQLHSKRP